jgi:hypothetical protein
MKKVCPQGEIPAGMFSLFWQKNADLPNRQKNVKMFGIQRSWGILS